MWTHIGLANRRHTGVCERSVPLARALTVPSGSRNSCPPPDSVLWQLLFPHLFFSGGVFFHRHWQGGMAALQKRLDTDALYRYGRCAHRDPAGILWYNYMARELADLEAAWSWCSRRGRAAVARQSLRAAPAPPARAPAGLIGSNNNNDNNNNNNNNNT